MNIPDVNQRSIQIHSFWRHRPTLLRAHIFIAN
jgi:hypothetical protein